MKKIKMKKLEYFLDMVNNMKEGDNKTLIIIMNKM